MDPPVGAATLLMLAALGACQTPVETAEVDAARRFRRALGESATELSCASLGREELIRECLWVHAGRLADQDPAAALVMCEGLEGWAQGECVMIVADHAADGRLCDAATPYEDRCRTHVLRAQLEREHPEGLSAARAPLEGLELLRRMGLPEGRFSSWLTIWMFVLEGAGEEGLRCDPALEGVPQAACRRAVRGHREGAAPP